MNMHSLKTPIVLALVAASPLLFTGCSSTVNTTERSQPVGERQMVSDKRILTDRQLSIRSRIVGVNTTTTEGGYLKVQAELQNDTRSARRILYQWEWFDKDGMQVKSPAGGGLVPLDLEGKESKFISGVAPSRSAQDFRLKLIKPE